MSDDELRTLGEVVAHEIFPEVDLRLREGGHVDELDLEMFIFLEDARRFLEQFYERFSCQLVRSVDGYYYLRPRGDRLGQRKLSAAEMLVGQALCLLRMDPGSLRTSWRVKRARVLEVLEQLVGADRLGLALQPRRGRRLKAVQEERIRDEVNAAIKTLARLGFVVIEEDMLRLRTSLLRFLEPVTEQDDPADALGDLIHTGTVTPGHEDDGDDGEGSP